MPKRKPKDKQMVRVLDAVNMGCETSEQVHIVTGLRIAIASHYLCELANSGLIRRVKREATLLNKRGRKSNIYFPITGRTPPLDVGPLTFVPNEDSYVTPIRSAITGLRPGFVRADTLVQIGAARRRDAER